MSFVLADIPGIIEGASEGRGLGHEFLRHIERTRILIHVVDVSGIEGRNPLEDFEIINNELSQYDMELEERPQIIAANKTDILQDESVYEEFKAEMEKRGYKVFSVSAATNQGVTELMKYVYNELQKLPPVRIFEADFELDEEIYDIANDKGYEISKDGAVYVITGSWIEAVGGSVNFSDRESLQYFQRALTRKGVIDALVDAGIQENDLVRIGDEEGQIVKIGDLEFEFVW